MDSHLQNSHLQIRLFGHLEIAGNGVSLSSFPTRKARALFAYLALHAERLHAREVLAGLFWPDSSGDAGRKRLRTELWQMRRFLEPVENGRKVFLVDNGSVGVDPAAGVWIDRVEFERKLAPLAKTGAVLGPDDARSLAEAVELHRADLLEGFYEDWCVEAREYLRVRRLAALEKLMTFHQEREEWERGIFYGEEVLRHEPLDEHVHRELMRCHAKRRNRTAALRQYERCVAVLAKELDVEPMPETVELYRQVRLCR